MDEIKRICGHCRHWDLDKPSVIRPGEYRCRHKLNLGMHSAVDEGCEVLFKAADPWDLVIRSKRGLIEGEFD